MSAETVLVTGASSGIGRELARLFAADGCRLILVARRRDELLRVAEDLRERYGAEVIVSDHDLSEPAAPQAIFEDLANRCLAVDVLVNNAGFGAMGSVAHLSLERQLAMLQVNVVALTHLTRLFLPAMLERRRGGVLNIGSTAGFQPGPNMAVYYATKAYVLSFSEALAEELSGTGLQVSCLAPGPTATEFGAVSGMNESAIFKLGVMNAQTVAEAGYRGFRRGEVLTVPGFLNRLGAFAVRWTPRKIVRKVVKRLQG